jgi:hypothetical protein
MQREKLLIEQNSTKLALVDKINFIYSWSFYELSDVERKRYIADKNATEAHLSTISNLLWAEDKIDCNTDMLSMFLLTMFLNGGGMWGNSSTPSIDYLKKQLEDDEKKEAKQDKDIHCAVPV